MELCVYIAPYVVTLEYMHHSKVVFIGLDIGFSPI